VKSTARNQWPGKVVSVLLGAVTAEIVVALDGGTEVVASVTVDSAKRMGLESGREVLVLVKAHMVILALDFDGYVISARNQLAGVISDIKTGPVTADVTLSFPNGDTVTAAITTESLQTLGLSVGQNAIALFKSGSVVLAAKKI
jgi:molybdate transport system regulatory protein